MSDETKQNKNLPTYEAPRMSQNEKGTAPGGRGSCRAMRRTCSTQRQQKAAIILKNLRSIEKFTGKALRGKRPCPIGEITRLSAPGLSVVINSRRGLLLLTSVQEHSFRRTSSTNGSPLRSPSFGGQAAGAWYLPSINSV